MNTYVLTTLARQKTAMGLSGSTYDTLLETLIGVATDFIETYCSRRFKETTYTEEVYDGTGIASIVLKNYPVKSGAAFTLQERDSHLNEDEWDSEDAEDYFVDLDAGIVRFASRRFMNQTAHYRVTYTAGYPFSNVTAPLVTLESLGLGDLEWACWEMVKKVFLSRQSRSDIQQESIGDYSVTFRDFVLADPLVRQILEKYIRRDDQL